MNETIQNKKNNKGKEKTIVKIICVIILTLLCITIFQGLVETRTNCVLAELQDNNTQSITKYVTANGLNVRSKYWRVIDVLPKNSKVTVIIENYTDDNLYDLVLYNDTYVYMANKYLTTIKPQETTQTEINSSNSTITNTQGKYLGKFSTTAYCNCSKCCGKWAGGPTASGVMPKEGRTIAVDPKVIPLGTKVIINGHTYIAEDTGSAIKGKKIDIYYGSHSSALRWGRRSVDVYLAS